jgi:hypothetical protein
MAGLMIQFSRQNMNVICKCQNTKNATWKVNALAPFRVHPDTIVNLFRMCQRDFAPAHPCQEDPTSVNTHWHVGMLSSCLPSKARKANRQVCIVLCISLSRSAYKFTSLDSCYKRFGDSGGPLKMEKQNLAKLCKHLRDDRCGNVRSHINYEVPMSEAQACVYIREGWSEPFRDLHNDEFSCLHR